jgi:F420-dependent oxidoreductase-like protein
MEIGLQQPFFKYPGGTAKISGTLGAIARTAESSGFSSLWVMDHFYQVGQGFGPPTDPILEAYTTLGYLAGVTERISLGTLVTGSIYRDPGLLTKIVTTLDVLSGGRAYLGIGTGWYKEEAEAFGIPFPDSRSELIKRFVETLKIAKHIWSGESGDFEGRFWTLKSPINNPEPITKPHPPILIGCEGESTMLRIVARYADAVNLHIGTPLLGYSEWMRERYSNKGRVLSKKLGILSENCEKIGRDYSSIEKTGLATIHIDEGHMSLEGVKDLCYQLHEIGFHHVIFNMPNAHQLDPLKMIGEQIIPEVRNL